jgi:hypothetical protein
MSYAKPGIDVKIQARYFLAAWKMNALADSRRRATVLSFKGLVFNLGYGFVSLLFAGALRMLRDGGGTATEIFGRSLVWLPIWLVSTLIVLVVAFWRHSCLLRRQIASGS